MAIKVRDLIEDPSLIYTLGRGDRSGTICVLCESEIEPGEQPEFIAGDKPVHADCYFGALGKLIEESPIPRLCSAGPPYGYFS